MMQNDDILKRLGEAPTLSEATDLFLYHGTGVDFDSEPRAGGYDGIFWCADSPSIAQNYIPVSGGAVHLSVSSFSMREKIRPTEQFGWYSVAKLMGFEARDIKFNIYGEADSFIMPKGYPTYADACKWLTETMGYKPAGSHDLRFVLRTDISNSDETIIRPADYNHQGRLFVVDGRGLNMLDFATGREGDLTDPDHNRFDIFKKAHEEGYDGVIINDFCQSASAGNLGHVSYGFFPETIKRLDYATIPAANFDWEEAEGYHVRTTPEFEKAYEDNSPAQVMRL